MVQPMGTQITCPNCHQPFSAVLEQIVDVGRDPQAKVRLLSGRLNMVTCPNCAYQLALSTPLIYHDPDKSLLIVHVPMELGLPQSEQERLIGNLTNAVINSLPQEQRKGYLFTPKTALTMQGLVDTVREADGITKEMIEAQRAKLRLVETFLQVEPEELPALVEQHDEKIDDEFFAMLAAYAESAAASGRRDMAEHILDLREKLLEQTTVGKTLLTKAAAQEATIQEVADALNALGDQATQEDLVNLTFQLAADGGDERLQVLVGLARPAMDYSFFEALSARIDDADDDEKEYLTQVRDRLVELTGAVDQQNQAIVGQAVDALRAIANSEDLDAAIRARIDQIDDTFLAVLTANIQNAEQKKDLATAARLKQVFDTVLQILQEGAPPAIRFINELMQIQDLDEARQVLETRVGEFGAELVQWMDMVGQDLATRGSSQMALERLGQLREAAAQALAVAGANGREKHRPSAQAESESDDGSEAEKSPIILPFSRKRPRR